MATPKLKALRRAHYDSNNELARSLGITPQTLCNKTRNGGFTQREIKGIIDRYCLTADEVMDIFFNDNI